MQTTAIRTVANSLPNNGIKLLTLLISKRYIPYTDLRKLFAKSIILSKKDCLLMLKLNIAMNKVGYTSLLIVAKLLSLPYSI